jgi:1-acyl-sn-glycerol-3-phosphate acyltransferase
VYANGFSAVLIVRSTIFNLLYYLNLITLLLMAVPTLFMPQRAILFMAKSWGWSSLWLLRVICGLKVEFRGLEKITNEPLIIAAKHQSTWETFALVTLLDHPTFIVKRELMWVPFFGWFMWKGGMIPVNRGAGAPVLAEMAIRARSEIREGRQLVIFPEGTRRAPGAEPHYRYGVAHLYAEIGVPCIPVALNSGLYWRRRSFLRWPGTVRVEFLDPIPPGLDKQVLLQRLQNDIETATTRLMAEGKREIKRDAATA